MKIDLMPAILDPTGKAIPAAEGLLTVRDVCVRATLESRITENTPKDEKLKRFQLAMRLQNSDAPELELTEAAEIENYVGDMYNALIYGRVHEHFKKSADGTSEPLESPKPAEC
jgi:hypothetical protein